MVTVTHATTRSGSVEGRVRRGAELFASIPYAAPPVGLRRFAPPQPHAGWDGVRDCTRFGPAAPQLPAGGLTSNRDVAWDEDSLTLNVTTPAVDGGKRPVLVWVHGGAYVTGQGNIPWYSGAGFATKGDIVTVSINYRLGVLGFADLSRFGEEFSTSATNGLLDMVAALEWVRDNIERFGGDPQRVTIAGESAGAFAVTTLLTMPAAKGLFSQAIAQSGAGHHTMSPEQTDLMTDLLLTELGVSTINDLRALDARSILDAQSTLVAKVAGNSSLADEVKLTTGPFYPGHGNVALPLAPVDASAAGAGADVALLTGSNLHETSLFQQGRIDEQRLRRVASDYSEATEALIQAYVDEGHTDPHDIGIAMSTDWSFRIPAVRTAEARHQAGASTWMYLFSWESRHASLRSTHALEIPFTFDTLDAAGVDVFIGPGDSPQHVADAMHEAWIAYITSGDPSTAATGTWPRYATQSREVVEFNDDTRLLVDPQRVARLAWTGLR